MGHKSQLMPPSPEPPDKPDLDDHPSFDRFSHTGPAYDLVEDTVIAEEKVENVVDG